MKPTIEERQKQRAAINRRLQQQILVTNYNDSSSEIQVLSAKLAGLVAAGGSNVVRVGVSQANSGIKTVTLINENFRCYRHPGQTIAASIKGERTRRSIKLL